MWCKWPGDGDRPGILITASYTRRFFNAQHLIYTQQLKGGPWSDIQTESDSELHLVTLSFFTDTQLLQFRRKWHVAAEIE